jgi:hypothetical protein
VEYFVSYYDYYQPEAYVPQRDLFIEKDSSINEHIEQMRLSATKSLLERRDVVIVATVSAIYGIGNPSEYHQMILTLRAATRSPARRHRPPDRDAVHAQRTTSSAAPSACAATPSTSSRPSTPSWRCASSCSTTRSIRCSCSTR